MSALLESVNEETVLDCRFRQSNKVHVTVTRIYRGYYMATREYEFYLRVLKVSLTSELSERVRDTFSSRVRGNSIFTGAVTI